MRNLIFMTAFTSLLASGCGADPATGPDPPQVAEARATIEATRLSDASTLHGLSRIRFTAAGLAASADLLRGGVHGDPLWGALYVYGGRGIDPAPIRPYLASSDTTIRSFASEGLAAMGDLAGLESLVEALVDEQLIAGSEPPRAGWQSALVALEQFTEKKDLGPASSSPTMSERVAARDRWAAWLTENKTRLVFDSAARVWRAQ